ncbi:MAG: hypothetical protein H0T51_25870 [Pirellulales bacterium]|nr:hypothetical protein [Pirellulales bacterium]
MTLQFTRIIKRRKLVSRVQVPAQLPAVSGRLSNRHVGGIDAQFIHLTLQGARILGRCGRDTTILSRLAVVQALFPEDRYGLPVHLALRRIKEIKLDYPV